MFDTQSLDRFWQTTIVMLSRKETFWNFDEAHFNIVWPSKRSDVTLTLLTLLWLNKYNQFFSIDCSCNESYGRFSLEPFPFSTFLILFWEQWQNLFVTLLSLSFRNSLTCFLSDKMTLNFYKTKQTKKKNENERETFAESPTALENMCQNVFIWWRQDARRAWTSLFCYCRN